MSEYRLSRRAALRAAGAIALATACTPVTQAPGAPTGVTAGTPAPAQRAPAKFRWLFGFTIQANPSLPVILAKELGYYREQDIDISWDFVTSGGVRLIGVGQYEAGSVSNVQMVADAVSEGVPVKAICQQGQDDALRYAVRKGSGIAGPKDFEGKKVGVKGGRANPAYLAMLAHEKVDRSKITEVPVGFSSVELKEGIVDVLPVFVGNEPFVLRNQLNVEIELIHPADHGYPAVGTAMIANTDYIEAHRDEMTRFLKATMKAQEFFIEERDRTLQIAVQYGGTATTRAQQEFIYDVSREDMKHPKGVGWLDKERWQKNIDTLSELGVLKEKPNIDDLVDTSFMEEILKDGKVAYP